MSKSSWHYQNNAYLWYQESHTTFTDIKTIKVIKPSCSRQYSSIFRNLLYVRHRHRHETVVDKFISAFNALKRAGRSLSDKYYSKGENMRLQQWRESAKCLLERLGKATWRKQHLSRDLQNEQKLASKLVRNNNHLAFAPWCSVLELRSCQH